MLKKWQSLAIIMTEAEKKITESRKKNHNAREILKAFDSHP
jgi:hypothetical protein